MIYFDNSATTYPKPECVYKALDYANRNLAFNAGRGQYGPAINASNCIDEARQLVSSFINCDSRSVTFFSSATESLNIIINGLNICDGDNVYISPFEHNAIVRPLYNLKKSINFEIHMIPFIKNTWDVDFIKLQNLFAVKKPKAVLLSSISNVTGFILPYEQIFSESKKMNAINILDCAQSFGVYNTITENIDFIVFAGHKTLYTSFGIAGFINLTNYKLKITKSGGNGSDSLNHDMPNDYFRMYESGSPNIVAIYGLIESCNWLKKTNVYEHEKHLTEYLINRLEQLDNIIMYLPKSKNVFGIVSLNVYDYTADDVSTILYEEFDICVRSGYHCSPFIHDFLDTINYKGTIRISLGAFNTLEEIDTLIDALKTL